MLCLSGFELYSRWVPLTFTYIFEICNQKQIPKFDRSSTISVLRCKSLLYVRIASRTYSNLACGACGSSNAECIAIIEKTS